MRAFMHQYKCICAPIYVYLCTRHNETCVFEFMCVCVYVLHLQIKKVTAKHTCEEEDPCEEEDTCDLQIKKVTAKHRSAYIIF
jgi:hypothetical protein